jgi:hypothetical protein
MPKGFEAETITLDEATKLLARLEHLIVGRTRRRRRYAVSVAAAFVLASTIAVVSLDQSTRLGGAGAVLPPTTGDPSGDAGVPVSIAQAAAKAPFTLYLPTDPLASPAESQSWISTSLSDGGSLTRITIKYATGVVETMTQSNGIDYEQLLGSFGGQASLISLNGVQALAVPPNSDGSSQNMAVVDATFGKTRVVVMGSRSLADIERIAGSLTPYTS